MYTAYVVLTHNKPFFLGGVMVHSKTFVLVCLNTSRLAINIEPYLVETANDAKGVVILRN